MIRVYGVNHKTLGSGTVIWDNVQDTIMEIKTHLEEGYPGDTIEIMISEMSEEDYAKLPEFEGY